MYAITSPTSTGTKKGLDLHCQLRCTTFRQWFLKVMVTGPDRHTGNNQSLFFFLCSSLTWVCTKSTQLSKSTIYHTIPLPLFFLKMVLYQKRSTYKGYIRILCPNLQVPVGAGMRWFYRIMHLDQVSISAIVCIALDPLPPGPSCFCDLALPICFHRRKG